MPLRRASALAEGVLKRQTIQPAIARSRSRSHFTGLGTANRTSAKDFSYIIRRTLRRIGYELEEHVPAMQRAQGYGSSLAADSGQTPILPFANSRNHDKDSLIPRGSIRRTLRIWSAVVTWKAGDLRHKHGLPASIPCNLSATTRWWLSCASVRTIIGLRRPADS